MGGSLAFHTKDGMACSWAYSYSDRTGVVLVHATRIGHGDALGVVNAVCFIDMCRSQAHYALAVWFWHILAVAASGLMRASGPYRMFHTEGDVDCMLGVPLL